MKMRHPERIRLWTPAARLRWWVDADPLPRLLGLALAGIAAAVIVASGIVR